MIRKIILVVAILIFGGLGFWVLYRLEATFSPKGVQKEITVNKLEKYDFDELKKRGGIGSDIKILGEPVDVIKRRKDYKVDYKVTWISKIFSFESNGKIITGMINYMDDGVKRPVIVMIRGFAESAGYYTGSGTWKAADKLAESNSASPGYVTVSIDFLGYGGSEKESADALEARFEKVVSVMDLIEAVKKIPYVDQNRIGIWAHSNGGQIALSVLEVTGGKYPTVLWAPMTEPFPASIIDTNDPDSPVKAIVDEFQKKYDARRYAFENYYAWVQAPLIIHQGTADVWCKVEWQQNVVNNLKALGKEATLYVYPGDDHNFSKNWDEVVGRDIGFFRSHL